MDLDFIAGDFIYGDLPHNKEYLKPYFRGQMDRAFLCYYFLFADLYEDHEFKKFYTNFIDHTGNVCSERWVYKLLRRLYDIEEELKLAEKNLDFNKIGLIQSGRISVQFGVRKFK